MEPVASCVIAGQLAVMCTTVSPVNRIVIWNQCVAASLRQSFVVHITEMLPNIHTNGQSEGSALTRLVIALTIGRCAGTRFPTIDALLKFVPVGVGGA